jgi:hypothetical protein
MPNPLFDIEERDIENLTEPEFLDVLNRLLKAEAQKFGIPVQAVNTTMRSDDPDGGIDARIENSLTLPSSCRIPEGISVWQFKHGDSSPKEITGETQKTGVQVAIDEDGTYCYAISKGYGDRARINRKNALNKAFRDKGLEPKNRLFTAQNIADWVSDYPSVAMLPYFRRPVHDELFTFDQWENLPELRINKVGFEADPQREKIIAELGKTIFKKAGLASIRIAGRAGVGKSRLSFEAIKANHLENMTLYAKSIDGVPPNFFTFIEANPNIRLIMIVDETSYQDAIHLQQLVSRCEDRLFLITIGHDPTMESGTAEIPTYHLDILDDEALKKILIKAVPSFQSEIMNFIIKAAGGYVKLATALAYSIVRNPDIVSAAQLSGIPDVSLILETLVPEQQDRKVMEALSLLKRVGFDGEVASEARILAKFLGIDYLELQKITRKMIQTGLVVKRGRYRYVTPHLLAVWFAVNLWRAFSESIVDQLILAEGGLPADPAQSLLERLADFGEEDIATPVVEKLLNTEGLFTKLDDLNNEFRAKLFSTLAKAAPKAGVNALERILGHVPRDQLRSLNIGRRQIVWALENMLSWEDTFWIAARLLLKLAESENESYMNNATGVWCGIFRTQLGNSPIPALERYHLIQEAIESEILETRLIGLRAISVALSAFESGVIGGDAGGYIAPQAWKPKTWGQLWEAHRSALHLLDVALNDTNPEIVLAARKVLINSAQGLIKQGIFDDVFPRLNSLPLATEQEKIELWELYKRILHFLGGSLSEVQRNSLQQNADLLLGDSYHDRLRRWVGKVSPVDWKELKDQDREPEEMGIALAEEGFSNPDLIRQELSWLSSGDAVQGYLFFKRLGELDTTHEWLDEFVIEVRKGGNPNLLSAYLLGRKDKGEEKWLTQLLDIWSESEQQLALVNYETTRRSVGTEEGAARIIKLIDKGWLSLSQIGWIGWGNWLEVLSTDTIAKFLDLLTKFDDIQSTEIALVILMKWIEHHSKKDSSVLIAYAQKLLTRNSAINSRNMLQFIWENLAEFYLDDLAFEIADAIIKSFEEPGNISAYEDSRLNILHLALIKQPKPVWLLIGEMLLRKDMKGYELRLSMKNWGIESAGITTLIEWADANKPSGPCILAELAIPLSDLAQQLFIHYEDLECIENGLMATFLSGSFSGSKVQWLQGKLNSARDWARINQPTIRNWAQKLIEVIEADIKHAQQREEEEF